ncbi:MAG: SLC13 family permease [Rariglobus sp.]
MNFDLLMVLGLLGVCIGLFVANKPRMDVVALLVIVALPLTGVLNMNEALAGFGDPSVVLIAALFVIGEGLVRTGVAYRMGDWLVKRAGQSETRLIVLLMLSVAVLGSVMSSTGVVAIFIPVVLSIASRMRMSPSRLMMPLSVAGLISGMLTLVATPPNMVADSTLKREGHAGFGFFSFTPMGLVVLAMGVGYMLVARRWLGGRGEETVHGGHGTARRGFKDLIADYRLAGRARRLRIRASSPLVMQPLHTLGLRRDYGANVVAIEREGRFNSTVLPPAASTELRAGDVLLVDMPAHEAEPVDFYANAGLEALPLQGGYFADRSHEVGMAEVALPPESGLAGKTVLEAEFRRRHGLNVVGLRRGRKAIEGKFLEEKLAVGDTLLVIGPWKAVRQLQSQAQDFLVLSLPAEASEVAPARDRAPYALVSVVVMVVLMVTGWVPNVVAALIACLLMGAFRCVDMPSAYKSIHWQSLVLIAGMIPFALSLERTGGVALAAGGVVDLFGDAGPRVMLGGLFVLTAAIGLFISNTATAVLMVPVAVGIAEQLDASPLPFAMTVALAASAAFMTPVSSPVNTLVLGPGRYRFGDFVKIGVPFTVLVLIATVLLVPVLFPL